MPELSSKRKARRDSLTNSLREPEASSLRTENIPSISDRDFSDSPVLRSTILSALCDFFSKMSFGQKGSPFTS